MLIYVSHPRNGGTELARQIGKMLQDSIGATVYFPQTTSKHDNLRQSDLTKLAAADACLFVLNRDTTVPSTPPHVTQLELRRFSSRAPKPLLFVVRAEPCAIPEQVQNATLAFVAPPDVSEDEIVSRIAECILGQTRGGAAPLPATLQDYLQRKQNQFGVWKTRYTHLNAEISGAAPLRSLISDTSASADLDALLPNAVAQLSATLHPAWAGTDAFTKATADVRHVLYAHRRLALIGEPGSGKSTTLRTLLADLCSEALDNQKSSAIPVLVSIGELSAPDIEEAIARELQPATANDLGNRELWVMLDGLNETSAANVERVARWIAANPHVRLIVTSRRADYATLNLPLPVAELQPLSVEAIPEFLRRWGLAEKDADSLFWALAGSEAEQIWKDWQAAGESFDSFWRLESSKDSLAFRQTSNFEDEAYDVMRRRMREEGRLPGLLDVATNPFLLTLTLAIYNKLHELPRRRAVLFETYVDALLQHLARADPSVQVPNVKRLLIALAGAMNANGTTSLPLADIQSLDAFADQADYEAVLQIARSASILDLASGRVRFTHQLIQHYFGAFALAALITEGNTPSGIWREDRKRWWAPTIWDESAILLAGLADYNADISGKLTSPWDVISWITPLNPVVAWRCVEENRLDLNHARAEVLRRPISGTRAAPRARLMLSADFEERVGEGLGLIENDIPNIKWCDVPAGEFVFGDEEIADLPDFWIARFPITNSQFAPFVDAGAHLRAKYWSGFPQSSVLASSTFAGAHNPRDTVNWYEARAYCRWLTERLFETGDPRVVSGAYVVRLPSEREWEKAARGSDGRAYPWGSDFDPTRCNTLETGLRRTSPVGIFPDGASPYGAEEMAGNIWEWCSDFYFTQNATRLGVINKGGSCYRDAMRATAAYRADCLPSYHSRGRGFRVVLARVGGEAAP